jgi:cysteinyl-tRNA synthetase
METICLQDTLTRSVRPLAAGADGRFRMYVCGPTVYGPAHIGNFLTFVRFDVLYRTLQVAGYQPYYVRNITDVDDKTIAGAQAAGEDLQRFTERWTVQFHADAAALNLLSPDVEPRATAHIAEQIRMVERLVELGYAYVAADGSVYYRVKSFTEYGKLSHFDPEALMAQATNSGGSANLADEYERDAVADFALWKARKPADGSVYWDSPWGQGRPGWHLECSAMSLKYLGSNFDLHGGGEDLCFPHHENEIAQSESFTGQPFARHWMHCVHLLVEGRKMSKSLGNFLRLSDLLDKGYAPAEIRLAMLGGHYRQQFNFTFHALDAARSALSKLESSVGALLESAGGDPSQWSGWVRPEPPANWGELGNAWRALINDMNTPAVLGGLHSGLKRVRKAVAAGDDEAAAAHLPAVGALCHALGLELFSRKAAQPPAAAEPPAEISELAQRRWEAKQARDFATADALREQIATAGWVVVDQPQGYALQPAP